MSAAWEVNHFPWSLDLMLCIKISLNAGPAGKKKKNKRMALNQFPWNEVQTEKDHQHSRVFIAFLFGVISSLKRKVGTSLVIQWLELHTSNAGYEGSHMLCGAVQKN